MRKIDKIALAGLASMTLLVILLSSLSFTNLALAALAVLVLAAYGVLWKKLETNRKLVERITVHDHEPSKVNEELILEIQSNDTKKVLSAIAAMRTSSDHAIERLDQFHNVLARLEADRELLKVDSKQQD